jgi:hypothetical protein
LIPTQAVLRETMQRSITERLPLFLTTIRTLATGEVAKKSPHAPDQRIGLLERGEATALGHFVPVESQ